MTTPTASSSSLTTTVFSTLASIALPIIYYIVAIRLLALSRHRRFRHLPWLRAAIILLLGFVAIACDWPAVRSGLPEFGQAVFLIYTVAAVVLLGYVPRMRSEAGLAAVLAGYGIIFWLRMD